MLTDKLILTLSVALCVILVWVIKLQYPTYFSQNSLFAPIATILILGAGVLIYWKIYGNLKKCTAPSKGGAPGSCELDVDCNSANKAGSCQKTSDGKSCQCDCANGWSGPNCGIHGIPWDSPNCMGTNSQLPKNRNPGDMCVCPNDNWASGNGPLKSGGTGFVQCLKCGSQWGPGPSVDKDDSACTAIWQTQNLVGQNCWNGGVSMNQCTDEQKNPLYNYTGPNGEQPAFKLASGSDFQLGWCDVSKDPNVCSCGSGGSALRGVCTTTAWMLPGTANIGSCNDPGVVKPRNCSTYTCQSSGNK